MSQDTLCRELPLKELILLARHASRVSGFISLKTLAEYFPSLDIKTHLRILENLIGSRHIKKASRGYYTFAEAENDFEAAELKEELRALADAKRLVERVRVNLPPSMIQNRERTSTGSDDLENNTIQSREMIADGTSEAIQELSPEDSPVPDKLRSIYAEKLQSLSLDENSNGAESLESSPKCNDSDDFTNTKTISRNSNFTAEARRSAQGIKRKLEAARVGCVSERQNTRLPLLASPVKAPPSLKTASFLLDTPRPHDKKVSTDSRFRTGAVSSDLTASMAALKLRPNEDVVNQASKDGAARVDSVETDDESKSSTASLDPSAPEFMPFSFPLDAPLQSSTTMENPEVLDTETSEEAQNTTPTSESTTVEPVEDKKANSSPAPCAHVNLLPPSPKPRSLSSSPSKVTLPRTPIKSSPKGSSTPSFFKSRDESASKYHWTKKKTGDEVEDPCEALEIFCRGKSLGAPAYNVIFMPQEEVYFCLVHVGSTSFKSYPTMSLTKKRAMEVAAEKAVVALGITASMIERFRTPGSPPKAI